MRKMQVVVEGGKRQFCLCEDPNNETDLFTDAAVILDELWNAIQQFTGYDSLQS